MEVFDVYRWGILTSELVVEGVGKAAIYRIRHKDLSKNKWSEFATVDLMGLPGNDNFRLYGSLEDFPARLDSLSGISWSNADAIGWPNANTIYVRHRSLSKTIQNRVVTAEYWGARDASTPMDLILGPDDRLIAAVDVANDYVFVRRGYEEFTSVSEWKNKLVSQPKYGFKELDLARVPTRAGPRLATRVYLPEGGIEAPFPTILVRTPYGIDKLIDTFQQYAIRGYAVVIQAVRGTSYWNEPALRSEGVWQAMIQEPDDGADTLEWIIAQPWSNGSVCTQGPSYLGYTQWTLTIAEKPALKCLVAEVSMGTAFSDQPYMGGTFVQGMAYYAFWMLDAKVLPNRNWTDILRHRPIIDIDEYATGRDLPVWNNFFKHWRNDAFWEGQNWYLGDYSRNFATLQISGWFDDDYPGTRSNWALMSRYGTQPNRLILGPWKHRYNADRSLNGYGYGIDAIRGDIWLIKQKWYDYFLKGLRNGVTKPTVEYFVLGENQWRTATSWPPTESESQKWFFHSSGKADRHPTDGRLTVAPPTDAEAPDSYIFDPQDPVPNWSSFDSMQEFSDVQSYQYDFKDIETRHDVVTYTSPVLSKDLTIAGNIIINLQAATDVKDTDWWVYISDVTPKNESNRLSVGVLRARFRSLEDPVYQVFGANFEKEKLLSGNLQDIVDYEISIPSVANVFKAGHRIRIAVMNSNENYSFPNSNTGEDEGIVTETVAGEMNIFHTKKNPSYVLLPVMPGPTEREP